MGAYDHSMNGIGTDVEVNFKMPVAGQKQIKGRLHQITVESDHTYGRVKYVLEISQDYSDMAVRRLTTRRFLPKSVGSYADKVIKEEMSKISSSFLRETLIGKKEVRKAKYNKKRRIRQKRNRKR